ncbi:hypothetical protein V6N11_046018 [Hibiscus sabdariffa]|uniref:CCHC-type domain-containing protein n=2 Tax=Hibiscus sabdariffa TaxID=183260 RepID=A0ABR2Q399_9ROSI
MHGLFSSINFGNRDDMDACNFLNRDEGFLDPKGLIPVVDVGASVRDLASPLGCFHCKTFGHYDKTCPKEVNNDVDVGVRKKLDLAVGNLKKHGEAIWVPKKLMLSPSKGKGVVEKVFAIGAKSVVVEGTAKGKSVIAGSSNRFEVLVGMDPQDASTSQVAEDVMMEVPLEGQDALGQILEQPSRQPREAAKAVAKIVQGLKAKKKAKGNRGRGVASGGGGMSWSSPS